MRKISILLSVVILCTVFLPSCAKQAEDTGSSGTSEKCFYLENPYLNYIGQTRDEIFDKLDISDDGAENIRSFVWQLDNTPVSVEGIDFSTYLLFDGGETGEQEGGETLYSYYYYWDTSNVVPEECFEKVKAVYSALSDEYGEPNANPNSNTISVLLENDESAKYHKDDFTEQWTVPGECSYPGYEDNDLSTSIAEGQAYIKIRYYFGVSGETQYEAYQNSIAE